VDNLVTIYQAQAIVDAQMPPCQNAYIAIKNGHLIGAGKWADHRQHLRHAKHQIIDYNNHLLFPALVNAHTHFNLTHVCPFAYQGSFTAWLGAVISAVNVPDYDPLQAVADGCQASLSSGVAYAGDITPDLSCTWARRRSGVGGVSFLEYFGIGCRASASQAQMRDDFKTPSPPDLGIQPHAPYSADAALYQEAATLQQEHGIKLSTHLAETPEEAAFTQSATGPLAQMLKHINRWDPSILGSGKSPLFHLEKQLKQAQWLLAHCNYVSDQDIAFLARTHQSVAYCPVASDYFLHRDHRYRQMLAAGINVCLGTDSIICQPGNAPQPYGIFDQMRYLFNRDGADAQMLLGMATLNGLKALGLPHALGRLIPLPDTASPPIALAAVQLDDTYSNPLVNALENRYPVHRVTAHLS